MMARYHGAAGRLLAGGALLLLPVSALAAETADHGAEASGGMPHLDFSTYTSQIFWLIVFFVILYKIVSNLALPKIQEVVREREERISGDLNKAAELRAEAEEVYVRYEASIGDAHANAQAKLKSIRDRLNEDRAARQAELDAKLATKVSKAEARIAKARDAALEEIEQVALETAQAAAERLTGAKVNVKEARAALAIVRKEAA